MKKLIIPVFLTLAAAPALGQDLEEGLRLAVANCSQCHGVGESDASPFKDAPPFRVIHEFYAKGELEQELRQGIVAAHPAMPQWMMTPDQARDLAAYIMQFGAAKEE
jgi:mono/diheme cytochrome c family protein